MLNWFRTQGRKFKNVGNLIKKITKTYNKGNSNKNTDTMVSGAKGEDFEHGNPWTISSKRENIHIDMDNMDQNDEIVSRGLDKHADDTTTFENNTGGKSFNVVFNDDPEYTDTEKAKESLSGLLNRTGLDSRCRGIVRGFMKYGTVYKEIILNSKSQIIRFKPLSEYTMHPRVDEYGRFDEEFSWEQIIKHDQKNGIKFRPWQIARWAYGDVEGHNGNPLLKSSRRNWKRLQSLEDGLAMARQIRAYNKYAHKIPIELGTSATRQKEIIDTYRRTINYKRVNHWTDSKISDIKNPLRVDTDFFIPTYFNVRRDGSGTDLIQGDVKELDPNNVQLANIGDINYHLDRLIIALKVPRRMLNIPDRRNGALNESGLEAEKENYLQELKQNQEVLKFGSEDYAEVPCVSGLKGIIELQFRLDGIDLNKIQYEIILPDVSIDKKLKEAEVDKKSSETAKNYNDLVPLPPKLIIEKYMGLNEVERKRYYPEIYDVNVSTVQDLNNEKGEIDE